ncbi:MAG: hypothetical protein JWO30_1717 [Fibrobacteres bacterium]|nr:hypothetical protein [Fibrobacterota bacterium]
MQFGLKFALEGEHVVGYLTARLEETESEPTIRDIISVFRWMTIKKTYDVAGNTNLMKIMESKKNQIKEPMWRSFVEKELSEIKKQATN